MSTTQTYHSHSEKEPFSDPAGKCEAQRLQLAGAACEVWYTGGSASLELSGCDGGCCCCCCVAGRLFSVSCTPPPECDCTARPFHVWWWWWWLNTHNTTQHIRSCSSNSSSSKCGLPPLACYSQHTCSRILVSSVTLPSIGELEELNSHRSN